MAPSPCGRWKERDAGTILTDLTFPCHRRPAIHDFRQHLLESCQLMPCHVGPSRRSSWSSTGHRWWLLHHRRIRDTSRNKRLFLHQPNNFIQRSLARKKKWRAEEQNPPILRDGLENAALLPMTDPTSWFILIPKDTLGVQPKNGFDFIINDQNRYGADFVKQKCHSKWLRAILKTKPHSSTHFPKQFVSS